MIRAALIAATLLASAGSVAAQVGFDDEYKSAYQHIHKWCGDRFPNDYSMQDLCEAVQMQAVSDLQRRRDVINQ